MIAAHLPCVVTAPRLKCYFAEGPFCLIKILGMSLSYYGSTFMAIATSMMLGGMFSKNLQNQHSSQKIMSYGLAITTLTTAISSLIGLVNHMLIPLATNYMIAITILSQMGCSFGICMTTSNALALALVDYKDAIGTASSLFGLFYYMIISVISFCMGWLHNGTLLPMPLYFFGLSCCMLFIKRGLLRTSYNH